MGAFLQRSMSAKKLQDTQSERATGQGETMTKKIQCSECKSVVDIKPAAEYADLRALLEAWHALDTSGAALLCPTCAAAVCKDLRGETVMIEPIYICPTCGAFHEDGGRGRAPVYCDECGADWIERPKTNGNARG